MRLCPKCSQPMDLIETKLKILIYECDVCEFKEEANAV